MARKTRARRTGTKTAGQSPLADRIVEETLALAEERGWENVRLRIVAERLGVSLSEVVEHYRDLDGVADAWFHRAWSAMLSPQRSGFAALPARERLYLVMTRWFDALAPHQQVSVEMIRAKIYPSHPHHWVPLVFNLSRTIQWLRDAALLDATGMRRQVEEVGLTALFLATLRTWARDESEGQERTRDELRHRLDRADKVMARLFPRRGSPREDETNGG